MSNTLEYTQFGPAVRAFTTRRALGRNRERLAEMLSIEPERVIIPHQTHHDKTKIISPDVIVMSTADRKDYLEGVDAVITDIPGILIGVSTADCIPVLLYDEAHKAVAAIHAGWRGTVARIVQKTLRLMSDTYSTVPSNVKAVIGPGISLKNFEVGDEVYTAFAEEGFPMERISRLYKKWHLDLPLCNKLLLVEAGIKPENVHIEQICTYDNNDPFFSARMEQKGTEKCGRNFNAIMINDDNDYNQNQNITVAAHRDDDSMGRQ